MAIREKLEIIKESGEISFFEIEPGREMINFGSHPDNDVVLSSPGISPYHAMLDLRRKPYQFVQLSETGETPRGDQVLSPSTAREINTWDTIELGEYRITLIQSEAREKPPASDQTGSEAESGSPDKALAKPGEAGLVAPAGLAVRPPDQIDDAIVTEPVVPEYTLDAGQTLTLAFSISNGGETVADFEIDLEGLDSSWVTITPKTLHLKVNQRASVTASITPPRTPASRAGPHHFAVTVTSPNYPGRLSRRGATLVINPFFEFTISDLSPRQLAVSWSERTSTASMSVTNLGNSLAHYRVTGSDDEDDCSFEFLPPGENVRLANQSDFHLASDTTAVLPVFISVRKRHVVSLRRRDLQFTVTASPMEGNQPPRAVLGRLFARPLIGPWLLMAILAGLFLLAVIGFWPRMNLSVSATDITAGQPVDVQWTSWPPLLMSLQLNGEPLNDSRGVVTEYPLATTRYQLTGDTWASRLFSPGKLYNISRTVNVSPRIPQILRFQAEPPQVDSGAYTQISWSVRDADRVVLVSDVFSQTLDTLEGSQKIRVERQTVFTLKAYSKSLPGQVAEQVLDVAISPPPERPAPVILDFRVEPATITVGQPVTITWQVNGVDTISIQPLGGSLPPTGRVIETPTVTTIYILAASNGQETVNSLRQITVNQPPPTPTPVPTPTPTPAPQAPTIALFTVSPANPVQVNGQEVQVRLDWVVTGPTTNITLTGGPLGSDGFTELNPQDSVTLYLLQDAVFVLRAFNGSQQVLRTLEVRLQQNNSPVSQLAPYNLVGQLVDNPDPPPANVTLLTWSHNASGSIIGFRLYRNSGSGFNLIAAEDQLSNTTTQFRDDIQASCMSYYVVAIYRNSNNQTLESTASNTWTSPCP